MNSVERAPPPYGSDLVTITATAGHLPLDLGRFPVDPLRAFGQRGVRTLQPGPGAFHGLQSLFDRLPAFPKALTGACAQALITLVEFLFAAVKPLFTSVSARFPGVENAVPLVGDPLALVRQAFPLLGGLIPHVGAQGAVVQRSLASLIVIAVVAGTHDALRTHPSTLSDPAPSARRSPGCRTP